MKKIFLSLVLGGVFIIISGAAAGAADVGVGASFWYADWTIKPEKTDQYHAEKKLDPEILCGPVVSAKFSQNWSIAAAFLLSNKYNMVNSSSSSTSIRRMDSDFTLNYNINSYFKIFPGIKLMQFTFSDGYHRSAGPGLGAGFLFPVFDSLFIVGNGSYSYLFGQHKEPGMEMVGMWESGFNLSGGLAYYISAASLSISIGYRYQNFKTDYKGIYMTDENHVFKGFTASLVYSF